MMRRRLLPGGSSRGQRMSASPPRGFGYTSVESTYRSAAVHGREICAVRESSTLALSKPRAGEALIRCPRLEPPGGTRNAHCTSPCRNYRQPLKKERVEHHDEVRVRLTTDHDELKLALGATLSLGNLRCQAGAVCQTVPSDRTMVSEPAFSVLERPFPVRRLQFPLRQRLLEHCDEPGRFLGV